MAPFGAFSAFLKGCIRFYSSGKIEISPQDEMANPQGMKVFAVERHGLPEHFVSFRSLCGVQSSSSLVFAPNRAIGCGPLQGQAPRETPWFMAALS